LRNSSGTEREIPSATDAYLIASRIADPIDGAVGRPACHAFLGAGAARFIFEPKREFQLNIPVLLEMRHGDRQERDSLLIRVIREDRAHQLLGDLGKDHGRGD
jgi:hypothetical protein